MKYYPLFYFNRTKFERKKRKRKTGTGFNGNDQKSKILELNIMVNAKKS